MIYKAQMAAEERVFLRRKRGKNPTRKNERRRRRSQ